ncbi:MAG: hypothetical protein OEW62_02290 [Candidatus Bathyarchaeota archaeon]|nr:hypothetical protein [Candidatus Bathyarchaeota archaeon]
METPPELSTESLLEFNDVRLAFLSVFPLTVNESITREQAIEILKEKGINTEWKIPYSKDFKVAEEFLLPRRITDQYFRLKLNDFELSFVKMLQEKPIDIRLLASVFLTIYPKVGVGVLLFSVRLNHGSVDDLVFLQQSLYGRTKLGIVLSPPFKEVQKSNISLEEVAQKHINLILSAFSIPIQNPRILRARCVEIRSLSDFKLRDPTELFEKFPNQTYGLLVADEGWRFVPPETAKGRMQLKWRTRNFLSVLALAQCVIFVNFQEKETYTQYQASQKQIREKYGHEVEEYFTYSPEIAGLNHGPLFMLENASVQRFIIEQTEEQIIETPLKSIKEILISREKLLDVLSRLSCIKIPEIGLLGQNVQDAMRVSKGIEESEKKLEEVERTLLIRYNQRINLGIVILTVVSLGVGILSILIDMGLLNLLLNIIANSS